MPLNRFALFDVECVKLHHCLKKKIAIILYSMKLSDIE